MRKILIALCLISAVFAEQLKIKAIKFYGDEKKGVSIFTGNVNVQKASDELNTSKLTVYVDGNKKPTKFVAVGDVSFVLKAEDNTTYFGNSQKAIYFPKKKQYNFYTDVHLQQIGDSKVVEGDEVILNLLESKAYAVGHEKKPVFMIFEVQEEKKAKDD